LIAPRRQRKDGAGVVRLQPSEDAPFDIVTVQARADGVRLTFTRPVDETAGTQPGAYHVRRLALRDGSPLSEARTVEVDGVVRSEDGLQVDLELDVAEGGLFHLTFDALKEPDGTKIQTQEAWYTLNRVPEGSASREPEQ
jgi:hypothetical protein